MSRIAGALRPGRTLSRDGAVDRAPPITDELLRAMMATCDLRTINRLKNFRAVATRFAKRAYVFHGTVTVAAIRLRLRPQ